MRAVRPLMRWAPVAGLVLLVAGCTVGAGGSDLPQNALDPAGPYARLKDDLWRLVFPIAVAVFVLVQGGILYAVFRFRDRGEDDTLPRQIHGNTRLEIIWTLVPTLILVGIAVVVLVRIPAVQATGNGDGADVRVRVEAHQFYWQYVYPDGVVSVDRLDLAVDQPVELQITSLDVDHSWWVPELTGKRDALPGRMNTLRFTAAEEGTFEGKCAELCGALHPVMPTEVEILSAAAYERWRAEQERQRSGNAQAALGRETWERVCAECHGAQGEGDYGPPIAGSGTLVNRETLAELVQEGQNQADVEGYMPPVGRGWPSMAANSPKISPALVSRKDTGRPEGE
jgi:cytochrome c oxidase subunit II